MTRPKDGRPDPGLTGRLRAARERAGLSQREVAQRIGGSQPMVSLWEGGRYEPSLTVLRQLAAVYETTAAALIGDANRPARTRRSR